MSQENVEIVRRLHEAFNRGVEALLSGGFLSPEFVWDLSPSGIPGLGVYRGDAEVRSFLENDWFQTFPLEEWELELEELFDNGDQIVAMTRQRGRGQTSGAGVELKLTSVLTLREGQVVRVETHVDREKALEAARLSE
jgi:ketosteroid isomerase-like protein